jgi:DNA replication and repair protein RecF
MATSNRFDSDVLSVWENQMVEPADKIYEARRSFVDELVPVFQRYYDHISESREKVQLGYRSQLEGTDYSSLLKGTINKDRMLQYTSSGIHRDDLTLLMDEYAIRDLGSQGQQKSYMVALKLAKFDYIMSKGGIKPILLMDDVFDKFDENRVAQIIKLVSDKKFGQIFITDTHQERLQRILAKINIDFRLFKINNGVEEVIKNGK